MEENKPLQSKKEIVFKSIEEAGNYLKEKKEIGSAEIKREAQENPISTAFPEDRKRFLMYGISLLTDVSERVKYAWCTITKKAPVCYTTKEVAEVLRKIVTCRINGYSNKQIAHRLNETEETIVLVEKLAIRVILEAIEYQKSTGIPIVGNN